MVSKPFVSIMASVDRVITMALRAVKAKHIKISINADITLIKDDMIRYVM
jgi:hypothetical protein